MKILFIARAYPPIIGGIENHNHALSQWLPKLVDTKILKNLYGKKFLPIFLPFAAIYTLIIMYRRDTVILGDGVLGIIGWLVKIVYGKRRRVVCVLHGLDLTYPLPLYQKLWVGRFIPACDQLIAVSNATISTGVSRGIPESKFIFIPNGVDTEQFSAKDIPRSKLAALLQADIQGKFILYSAGRLVQRKGVDWFIKNVMPTLPENIIYAVSGAGPNQDKINHAIDETNMEKRVFILGLVTEEEREILLNSCDIFIQANIPIQGDLEGFGLVVLEASSSGIPVIASNIEGLKDAIHDKKNGLLVESKNPESFRSMIVSLLEDDAERKNFAEKAQRYTAINFNWQAIAVQYMQACINPGNR